MGERARVSVVVVNWNSGDDLPRCLGSVMGSSHPVAEVFVVDNASTDGSLERARAAFPGVTYLALRENTGFCAGANAGIARATGDAVLVLNPDAWLDARYLERALPHLDREGVGFVAGKVLRPDGRTLDTAGQTISPVARRVVERGYGEPDRGQFEEPGPIPSVCGAVALYGRRLLDRIAPGGRLFDEDFFAFWDDADVGARARRAGFRGWYEPGARAWHRRGGTRPREGSLLGRPVQILGRDEAIQFHVLKNRWLFLAKNESLTGLLLRAPLLAAEAAALAAILAVARPTLLGRLVRARGLLARAWARRATLE